MKRYWKALKWIPRDATFGIWANIEQNLENLFVYVLDNGCHESVGGYTCSEILEFPDVYEIIKISNDGKAGRVGLNCIDNTNQIKELFWILC